MMFFGICYFVLSFVNLDVMSEFRFVCGVVLFVEFSVVKLSRVVVVYCRVG